MQRAECVVDVDIGSLGQSAREGRVVDVVETSNVGGPDESYLDSDNRIVIQHSDRTHAVYSHLRQGGSLVELGEHVRAGEVIGYSGNTGFSSGPHLHFAVKRGGVSDGDETIAFQFGTRSGAVTCPAKGLKLGVPSHRRKVGRGG